MQDSVPDALIEIKEINPIDPYGEKVRIILKIWSLLPCPPLLLLAAIPCCWSAAAVVVWYYEVAPMGYQASHVYLLLLLPLVVCRFDHA